jgi:hypothetical protein
MNVPLHRKIQLTIIAVVLAVGCIGQAILAVFFLSNPQSFVKSDGECDWTMIAVAALSVSSLGYCLWNAIQSARTLSRVYRETKDDRPSSSK